MILDINFKSLWTGLNFIELPNETEFVYAVKEIKSIYIEELLEEMYPNNLSYDQFCRILQRMSEVCDHTIMWKPIMATKRIYNGLRMT